MGAVYSSYAQSYNLALKQPEAEEWITDSPDFARPVKEKRKVGHNRRQILTALESDPYAQVVEAYLVRLPHNTLKELAQVIGSKPGKNKRKTASSLIEKIVVSDRREI